MKNTMRSLLALLLMGISSVSATMESGATNGQGSSPTPSHADSTTSKPGSTILISITNITISQLMNLTQSTSTSNLPGDLQSTAAQTTAVTKTAPVTSTPEAPTENKASGKPTTTTKPMASDQPGTSESDTSHPTTAATKSEASHPTTPASESEASHLTTPASESKASHPTTPASESEASLPTTPTSESKASLPTTPTSESKASLPTTSASESKASHPTTPTSESEASLPTMPASESTASVPAITVSMTLATNKPTTASESNISLKPMTTTESNPSPQSTTATRSNPSPQPTTATESAMTRPRTTKLPVTSISETLRSAITTQNVVLGSTVPESIPKSTSSSPPSLHRGVITPSTNNTQQSTINPKSSKQVCEHLKLWIIEECNIQRIGSGKYTIEIYSKEIIDEPPSKMEISAFQQSYNTKLIAALVPTFILLFIVVLSSFFLWRRRSYRMNQQQLTEELHTCENGYHDNPTLEVMEVQPEMQEKKVALTKELHDTWIVPLDNLAKVDLLDEEDTHL